MWGQPGLTCRVRWYGLSVLPSFELSSLPVNYRIQAGPASGLLSTSRSYAALHQQQHTRPPMPPPAPRHASGAGGAVLLGRGGPGASHSGGASQPQQQHDRYGGQTGRPVSRHADELGADSSGFDDDGDDGETGGDLGLGAQHSAFIGVGSPGAGVGAFGRAEPSRGAGTGGFGGSNGPAAGPRGPSGQQAAGVGASGAQAAGGGFDDADAWNDSSSFLGGAIGAGARGGAANARGDRGAAAAGGAYSQPPPRNNPPQQRLDDPWAAPPLGAATGDDHEAWDGAPEHEDDEPELVTQGAQAGASGHPHQRDDQGGMDQPFVRALFKQQQQQQRPQPGANARQAGAKAAAGAKGKAAEPAGPSPAEVERAQVRRGLVPAGVA